MRESSVWLKFHELVKKFKGPKDNYQLIRVETGSTILGFPDAIFLQDGTTIFLEFKHTVTNQIRISAEQINMLERLDKQHFEAFVVTYKSNPRTGRGTWYICEGRDVRRMADEGLLSDVVESFPSGDFRFAMGMLRKMRLISQRDVDRGNELLYSRLIK